MAMEGRIFIKRLRSEFKKTAESFKVEMQEGNISEWKVELNVTNYGTLDVLINFPKNYPYSPPQVLIPRVFHPNVYQNGRLCMSILHAGNHAAGDSEGLDEKWTPSIWMESLLASLVLVLESPNLDSPANVDAKKLYLSNFEEYLKKNRVLASSRENEKIRKEQDLAFAIASVEDQKRAEEIKKLASQKEGKAMDEKEKGKAKDWMLDVEPDQDGENVISIRFRTPESILMRRFYKTSKFSQLLLYLATEGFRAEKFKLLSSFPRRDLTKSESSATLETLKLCHQETLIVETIDQGESGSESW